MSRFNSATVSLVGIIICTQLAVPEAYTVAYAQSASNAAHQSTTLYGRIEELSTQSGAQLPLNLTRQAGKSDQSTSTTKLLPGHATTYYGSSTTPPVAKPQASFPEALLGSWQGSLKVHSTQFSPLSLQVDREETLKQQELLAPGKVGRVAFTFTRSGGQLSLEPSRIVFSAPMSQSRHAEELTELGAANPMLGQEVSGFLQSMPYYYGLEMGNVEQGTGLTGNSLHNRVVKNDIRQLAQGIVEQDLVSYNQETNPRTGGVQSGYSEMVLRFYQQPAQQLYVQVASVNYLADGRFKDKILLYGTVQRGSGSFPAPYSTGQQLPAQPLSQPLHPTGTPSIQDMIKEMTNQFQ